MVQAVMVDKVRQSMVLRACGRYFLQGGASPGAAATRLGLEVVITAKACFLQPVWTSQVPPLKRIFKT